MRRGSLPPGPAPHGKREDGTAILARHVIAAQEVGDRADQGGEARSGGAGCAAVSPPSLALRKAINAPAQQEGIKPRDVGLPTGAYDFTIWRETLPGA